MTGTLTHSGLTDSAALLAGFAAAHDTVRDRAAVVSTLVDTVGVALAGRSTAAVRAVTAWLEPSIGDAVCWGGSGRVASSAAALVNGTAAHALDFDDAGLSMPIHPSAVLWPAVLAVAPPETPVARVLAAVEAGQAMFRAIADVLPIGIHYARGWHATGTIGRLAATAACGAVVGLPPERITHALGIAASTASGSIANFGTATKPLHVGLAARDAVMAVGLAAAGLTANPHELDDPRGFLARYGDPAAGRPAAPAERAGNCLDPADRASPGSSISSALSGATAAGHIRRALRPAALTPGRTVGTTLGERLEHWREHWVDDCVPKQFPSCFGTHRAVAAAVRLHARGVRAQDIERVRVQASPDTLRPLLAGPPQTPDEAKFNMAFTVARALQTGGLGLADFTAEVLADPAVRALAARVEVVGTETPAGRPELAGSRFAVVTVRLADGEKLEQVVTFADPADRPSPTDVDDKFVRCVAAAGLATRSVPQGAPRHVMARGLATRPGPGLLTRPLGSVTGPVSGPETGRRPGPGSETGPGPGMEPESVTGPAPGPETSPGPGREEPGPESAAGSETAPGLEGASGIETTHGPGLWPRPEIGREPGHRTAAARELLARLRAATEAGPIRVLTGVLAGEES